MPTYQIETHEWFETVATYTVEAESEVAAQEQVIKGAVAYDCHDHPGNDDHFDEVISCVQLEDERGGVFVAVLLVVLLLIFIGSGLISTLAVAGK